MYNSKKIIRFLIVSMVIFLIPSYAFSIVSFSYKSLSSEFLLMIFVGIFCSLCVVMMTEIKKYLDNKKTTENLIYAYFEGLYIQFTLELGMISIYLENPEEIVPDLLLDKNARNISNLISNIVNIEYFPFKHTKFYNNFNSFKENEYFHICHHIIKIEYLPRNICSTKRTALQNSKLVYNPTSADILVNNTLTTIKSDAEEQKKSVETFLNIMETEFPNRFYWTKRKASIDSQQFSLDEIKSQSH